MQYVASDKGDGWNADLATAQSAIVAISFNQSGLDDTATIEGLKFTRIFP